VESVALDKTQPWQAVTFRTSPDEFAMTHAVFIRTIKEGEFEIWGAQCGKQLPENMTEDIEAFGSFINTNWLSCPGCQIEVDKARKVGSKK
jgi:hypothetical protein